MFSDIAWRGLIAHVTPGKPDRYYIGTDWGNFPAPREVLRAIRAKEKAHKALLKAAELQDAVVWKAVRAYEAANAS
jgi:hypothetical protein